MIMIQNELLAQIPESLILLSVLLIGAGLGMFILGIAKIVMVWVQRKGE